MSKKPPSNQSTVSLQLRQYIERWEWLEEERKNLVADQKDVLLEAKSCGFDPKIIREIIRLRKMTPDERHEREALIDTYKAALGMLDGTPLGSWAIERLEKAQPGAAEPSDGERPTPAPADASAPAEAIEPATPEPTIDDARAMGAAAATSGKPVTSNPFPARDPRRAVWDESWCQALGTDGMDIPDALKPTPKPKKGGGEGGEE